MRAIDDMYTRCINFESISSIFLSVRNIENNSAINIKHENPTKWEGRTEHCFNAELVNQFQQAIGIPMGTYCVPLLADLFYIYADFLHGFRKKR